MSTTNTSLASYITSLGLFVKGLFESFTDQLASLPLESKIGITLGVATFGINWYYQRRKDRREEIALNRQSGSAKPRALIALAGVTATALLVTLIPMPGGGAKKGYLDPIGIPTKCMGDTRDVQLGRVYSAAECRVSMEQALIEHCRPTLQAMPSLHGHPFALAANCSWAYNAGVSAWTKTDAYKHGQRGEFGEMCRALQIDDAGRHIYTTGKDRRTGQRVYLPGLDTRRQLERLICEEDTGPTVAWQPSAAARTQFATLMRDYQRELARMGTDYTLDAVQP